MWACACGCAWVSVFLCVYAYTCVLVYVCVCESLCNYETLLSCVSTRPPLSVSQKDIASGSQKKFDENDPTAMEKRHKSHQQQQAEN